MIRLTLAATLAASYGMYGPAFELGEAEPLAPDREEYRNSEKYQIRDWDLSRPGSLTELIARINRIRHENPALQFDHSLRFHLVDNEQLIAYTKRSDDGTNTILVVVNLDPHEAQSGWVDLDLEALDIEPDAAYQVHDLVRDMRYRWQGARNYVMLDPTTFPAHVFRVHHREPSERDFEHFM
jgi:starch synthase (maltosyl-transferring)